MLADGIARYGMVVGRPAGWAAPWCGYCRPPPNSGCGRSPRLALRVLHCVPWQQWCGAG